MIEILTELIKFPKRSGETCFCSVSSSCSSSSSHYYYFFFFFFFFLSAQILPDSKGTPRTCRNPSKFCPDEFSLTTGQIVLKFGDMIYMFYIDTKFCKRISKRITRGHAPRPSLHKRDNISETVHILTPKPHIFLFLLFMIRRIQ